MNTLNKMSSPKIIRVPLYETDEEQLLVVVQEASSVDDTPVMRLAHGDDGTGYNGYVVMIGDKKVFNVSVDSINDDPSLILDMAAAIGEHLGIRVEHGEVFDDNGYQRRLEREKHTRNLNRDLNERELAIARAFVMEHAGASLPDSKLNDVFRKDKSVLISYHKTRSAPGYLPQDIDELEHHLITVLSKGLLPDEPQPVDNWEPQRITAYVTRLHDCLEENGWLDRPRFIEIFGEYMPDENDAGS